VAVTARQPPSFRVLGQVEVAGIARAALGGPKQRAMLAYLLLHANELVPRDRLVAAIWGEEPPATVTKIVQMYVAKLRTELAGTTARIETRAPGYLLEIDQDELDVTRFERLARAGREALRSGAAEHALALLDEALMLWHGDALADLAYEPIAQGEAARLEQLRLEARIDQLEAALALGELPIADLEQLVREHPYEERLRAQLILALYRSGRQADALEAYRAARETLDNELGLKPTADLHELECKILQHDPSLELVEAAAPTVLPRPPTRIIGRADDLAAIHALLREEAQVVTLVGPGGVGKTRLALEVAAESTRHVAFVDLSPLTGAEHVLPTVAFALGVLLIDNCEHVLAAAPELAAILVACPTLQLLATSRERLHIAAEVVYPVEPLAAEAAVALFIESAARVEPTFTPKNAVAEVCRRLDGLPLALELAAARVNVLTIEQILERLEQRLDLLTTGMRDAPARQKTLRATLEWSFELLGIDEKRLFAGASVFSGSFSLHAAEAVCSADVDLLASLVDKSLIRRRNDRFAMLETIGEHATQRLEASGETRLMRRRHAEYYLGLIEREDIRWTPAEVAERFGADHANLHAALAWAIESAPELALRLAAMLWSSWSQRGMLAEGRRRLDDVLEKTPDEPSLARAGTLAGAGSLAYYAGDYASSRQLSEAALNAAQGVDARLVVLALNTLGAAAVAVDDPEQARRHHEEAARVARSHGDTLGLAYSLSDLGCTVASLGRWEDALALFNESLPLRPGWPRQAAALSNIALAELQIGTEPGAVASRWQEIYDKASKGGEARFRLSALHGIALTAAGAGQAEQAVRVLAAAAAEREALGYALEEPERKVGAETVERLRSELGHEAFEAAWAEGRTLESDPAFALALEAIHPSDAPHASARHIPGNQAPSSRNESRG
jgi:predicted ATPase/DNA-binding SARP family transcriptional activator